MLMSKWIKKKETINFKMSMYSNPSLLAVNVFQDHLQKVKIRKIVTKYLFILLFAYILNIYEPSPTDIKPLYTCTLPFPTIL